MHVCQSASRAKSRIHGKRNGVRERTAQRKCNAKAQFVSLLASPSPVFWKSKRSTNRSYAVAQTRAGRFHSTRRIGKLQRQSWISAAQLEKPNAACEDLTFVAVQNITRGFRCSCGLASSVSKKEDVGRAYDAFTIVPVAMRRFHVRKGFTVSKLL